MWIKTPGGPQAVRLLEIKETASDLLLIRLWRKSQDFGWDYWGISVSKPRKLLLEEAQAEEGLWTHGFMGKQYTNYSHTHKIYFIECVLQG